MEQDRKVIIQRVAVIVLLIIFIAIFWYGKKKVSTKPASQKETLSLLDMARIKHELANLSEKKVEYKGKLLRDPLKKHLKIAMLEKEGAFPVSPARDVPEAKEAEEKLVLEGVIWGGREKLAIISGNVVAEGENVDSSKVKSIDEDRVVLMKDGREIVLTR